MQQRQGTKDVGMEYQFKVITFVAASLLDNADVQDFAIYSNADNIPGFDDVIVKVWFKANEQPHVYLGQVKHRQSKINFDSEKHKLANYEEYITKIIKEKDQINILSDVPSENIEFWFYSNNFLNKTAKLDRKRDQPEQILCNIAPNKKYKSIVKFKKPAGCFKLVPDDVNLAGDFFRRFHLFLNQSNNSKIDYDIQHLLEFSKESTERIVKYVDKFLNIPKIACLTKNIFEIEVFNIHLSSITVKPTSAIEMNIEQARIWNKITLTHDVTIVDEVSDIERNVFGCFWQQINDIYDCQFRWNDCIDNKGKLADNFDVQKFVDRSKLQQVRHWLVCPDTIDTLLIDMWKYYDLPRILKPTTDLSILQKYKHLQKKFVIIGNSKKKWDEIKVYCLRIFTDIASICTPQFKVDLLSSIVVSLQGRNPANLNDILAGDESCMKLLTCHHVLDLIKQRKTYIKEECFNETELMIFIITDDTSGGNFNVDILKGNGNTNIFIRSKSNQVNMYIKEIKSQRKLENYKIHVLREANCKLEYLKGRSSKVRNFLVDQDGQSVYKTKTHESILVIGKRLGLKDEEYINRHLRKTALDLTLFDTTEKVICLVYGNINSLRSNVKEIIEKSIRFNVDAASEIKETVIVTVAEKLVKQYWAKLSSGDHQLILLKASDGCLELMKYKNIRSLSKYISHSRQTFTKDEFFKEITNNLIVISGEPGMGKSYLLHKLSEICNERDYALFFNLSDYRRDFQQPTKEFLEDPLNFLFNKLETSKFQDLIKVIYDTHKNAGRLTVFLDSFDEILPFYEKRVLDLLERLIKLNIKVVVCSRLISDGILVDKFDVQLLRIDPVKRCDLIEYFANKNIKDIDLAKIPNTFLENPLYLNFLIFLHRDGLIDFAQVHVFDLYHKFLAKIVERYCYKYNQDYNPDITISTEKFLKNHKLLALLVVFGKEIILKHRIITNYDDLEKEFKCLDVKLGIVKYFSEGYPIFIHQTFAEFMAMEWLNANLFQEPSAKMLYEKMYLETDMNVRYLFDSMACNELPLHEAVLNDELEIVIRLCLEDDTDLLKVDKCGRTALHLASSYCLPVMEARRYKIVEVIIMRMQEKHCDLNAKDILLNWSWLDCLAHQNIDIIEAACYYKLPSILDVCLTGQEIQLERYLDVCYRTHLDLCFKLFEKSNELLSKCFCKAMEVSMDRQRLDIVCRLMKLAYIKNEGKPISLRKDSATSNLKYKGKRLFGTKDLTVELSKRFKFSPLHIACMADDEARSKFYIQSDKIDVNQRDIFGRVALHYNVIYRGLLQVSNLIDHTSDINAEDEESNTPLHFACRFSKVSIVTLLLARAADVNKINKHGETALHFAIYNWEEETEDALAVTKMIAQKIEVIAKPPERSKSLLWIASYKGFAKVVQILLDNGANAKEQSLLWIASYKGFANVIQILLDNGANVMEQEHGGDTALHWAASRGHRIVFENLVKANKTLLHMQNDVGRTATDLAVSKGQRDIIKYLLENGAERIRIDADGNTLVHIAARWGNVEILQTLIHEKYLKNSELICRNFKGQSALHFAVANDHSEAVYFLLNNGVEVAPVDADGCTPLHYAKSAVIAKLLLNKHTGDLSADTQSNSGQTPLHAAAKRGYVDVIQELLEEDLDTSSKDNTGSTPLHLAIVNRKLQAASILVQNGADVDSACNKEESCLHKAVILENANIVQMLLRKNANVQSKDSDGNTALHLRIMHIGIIQRIQGRTTTDGIVNLLLNYGGDRHAINYYGESALDIARRLNLEELFACNVDK